MGNFQLNYTGQEINEKLGKVDGLQTQIDQLSSEIVDEIVVMTQSQQNRLCG